MTRFNRIIQPAALSALLLCFSLSSSANEIQDANKFFKRGQPAQALVKVDTILATQPSYATAHENLGDLYAKMASQAYDRALQLDRSKSSTATKLATIKDMHTPVAKVTVTKIQLASVSTPPAPVTASPVRAAATVPAATASTPAITNADLRLATSSSTPGRHKSVWSIPANPGSRSACQT